MKRKVMDGYKEAEKVDAIINKAINENPISKDNVMEWMKFLRTIQSGINILNEEAKVLVDIKTEEVASKRSGNKNGYKVAGPIIKE